VFVSLFRRAKRKTVCTRDRTPLRDLAASIMVHAAKVGSAAARMTVDLPLPPLLFRRMHVAYGRRATTCRRGRRSNPAQCAPSDPLLIPAAYIVPTLLAPCPVRPRCQVGEELRCQRLSLFRVSGPTRHPSLTASAVRVLGPLGIHRCIRC